MTKHTLREAQELLPEARRRVGEITELVSQLQRLAGQMREGEAPSHAADDLASLEAAVDDAFLWFEEHAVQVKSLAPALLDFPARAIRDGEPIDVLLCWRDDEDTIAYYHPPETGYISREPVALLDDV